MDNLTEIYCLMDDFCKEFGECFILGANGRAPGNERFDIVEQVRPEKSFEFLSYGRNITR